MLIKFISKITKNYLRELLTVLKDKNLEECSFEFPTTKQPT